MAAGLLRRGGPAGAAGFAARRDGLSEGGLAAAPAIPYGERRTYGGLASELETILGRKTSARAVGAAVGRNPISLLIPCHRVVGSGGSLTGYAGGLERKAFLLALEENHAG